MTESWTMDSFRAIFSAIDSAVYSLISVVYEILMQITNVKIFGEGAIDEMASKIYTLLGIFMLFKVTFSFITYLVSPDQMTDKSKGAQKIILNILLVLAMIIITPTVFEKLYEVQNAILTDNIIPKFIMGTDDDSIGDLSYKMADACSEPAYAKTNGDYISLMVFRPFYQIEQSREVQSSDFAEYCQIGVANEINYGTVSQYLSVNILNSAPRGMKDKYVIDYKIFVSTLVGVVVLLLLVSFCFDVAVRTIKLGFLEIIAPIPIISYVDPKSGKDGMFKKWMNEVGKTWADLFIRLIALFFAIYIIKFISIGDTLASVESHKLWVTLFIIIGALMFAKKLPKLIEDILGIKLGSELTLNPMKKIRDNALGGKAITGALKGTAALGAGVALGAVANAGALTSSIKKDGLKKALMGNSTGLKGGLRAAGTILGVGAGGISAGIHSAYGTYKNDSIRKGIMPGVKKSVDNRDKRDKEQDAGYSLQTKVMDKFRGVAGIKTEAKIRSEQAQSKVSRLQALQNNISFRQQSVMHALDSSNLEKLTSVTTKEEQNVTTGAMETIYTITDDAGREIRIGNENDLRTQLSRGLLGNTVDATNMADAIMHIQLQAQRNALDKQIFNAMKTQKTFEQKDAEAKK